MSNAMIETGTDRELANSSATEKMGISRVAAEVQAAMIVARRFPRDEVRARDRIKTACCRHGLAEVSQYEFSRGGQKITGPSIRLLEVVAGAWGNLDFGFTELERKPGASTVLAYAWDLETNTRSTRIFDVPHKRDTKSGSYALTEDRDIYERVANDAQRRVRSCLETVIPGDVVEEAVEQCAKTLLGQSKEPFADRVVKMVDAFKGLGVTREMIEAKLNHPVGSTTPHELARLGSVFNSIRDGIGKVEEHFTVEPTASASTGDAGSRPKSLDEFADKAKAAKAAEATTASNATPEPWAEWLRALSATTTVDEVESLPIPGTFDEATFGKAAQLKATRIAELRPSGKAKGSK